MRTAAALLAAPLVLLALTGCSGGDGGDEAGSEPLSKDDYVSQANQVCREARERSDAVQVPNDPAAIGGALEESLRISGSALDSLEGLEPPEADAEQVETRFTGPARELFTALEERLPQIREAIAARDPEAFRVLEPDTEARVDTGFLQGYGLTDCANLSGAPPADRPADPAG